MTDEYSKGLDLRNTVELENTFSNIENIVSKNYLTSLEDLKIVSLDESLKEIDIARNSRFFKLSKLVYDTEENSIDKLSNVLNAISFARGNIAVIINSNGEKIEYYLGVLNKGQGNNLDTQYETLSGSFNASFQGSKLKMLKNSEVRNLVDDVFDNTEGEKIISSISGVASLNIEKGKDIKGFIQGLEKLTDAMQGKEYSLILIADSISEQMVNNIRAGYEGLYSKIYPFMKTNVTLNESDTVSLTEGITESFTNTINESITHTQNTSSTEGTSMTDTISQTNDRKRALATMGIAALGSVLGPVGAVVTANIAPAMASAIGQNSNSTAQGTNSSSTESYGESNQSGTSESKSRQNSTTKSDSNTVGKSVQINCENKSVKSTLEKIDKQLERIKNCDSFGCFSVATYVISNNISVNNSVAATYNSLMKGEDSSVESSVINTWSNEYECNMLQDYLSKFMHPMFNFNLEQNGITNVTPTLLVNSKELALHLMLPKKSIQGISVIESTSFGRNIFKLSQGEENLASLELGKVYHMGNIEQSCVNLTKKSLAMHTFITGSTGSGKSNTVYQMLNEFNKNNVKFLVVEPAKGEYKNVFGNREDVTVLGTNSKCTKLLRINPFRFVKEIHVLEHIDKLVEIFNACWPMYAAMPAILKDAIERAYESAGWDLLISENKYNDELYPTFIDVLEQLNEVINNSAFSEELKGNYIGALSTRVKSLTNGINGQIFCGEEIDNTVLFDSNVIVDLSRVGSIETKSMIMGILIMRLQEHRMSQGGMNKELHHVTVLEEAHNILKRTSTEQSGEGSNLLGKSVEMLSNSIAEMRTYGEGFVIVDQSPNMLDMSAIRNTNTKIILRLPEYGDRELVGKSIGLKENQIGELAKLETGVASVYQNDWLEPILCKVNYYGSDEKLFVESENIKDSNAVKANVTKILINKYNGVKITENIDLLKDEIIKSKYSANTKIQALDILNGREIIDISDFSDIIKGFYYDENLLRKASRAKDFDQWNKIVLENLDNSIDNFSQDERNIILQSLLREVAVMDNTFESFYFGWTEHMRGDVK